MNWRAFRSRPVLLVAVAIGLVTGVAVGVGLAFLDSDPTNDFWFAVVFGVLVFGLPIACVMWLVFGLTAMDPPDSIGPVGALIVGLTVGLAVGVGVGLPFWFGVSLAWHSTLAWLQLRRSHRVPGVALMPLLEDARARHVLRTVGAVYQFRHATLQDQLAGQTTAGPATSLAASRTS